MPDARDHSRLLKSQYAVALESIVARFETEWEKGRPPVIDAYLAEDCPARGELLVELIHADLEYRWKSGDAANVASYLERYPEILDDAEAVAELREAEGALRNRYGGPPETAIHMEWGSTYGKEPGREANGDAVNAGSLDSAIPEYPTLGKFELLQQVGQGAFGTVYMARDTNLDRIVAVKVPRHGRFGSKEEEERFIREAQSAAQLQHPGIIPVFEVGRTDAHPFIVSEFVEGVTLDEAIYARPFSPKRAARLAARLAEALEHAHRHGVIHRDLKPSNVILQGWTTDDDSADSSVSASGRTMESHDSTLNSGVLGGESDPVPRLMDFGLARRVEGSVSTTVEGVILGTPAYMSPEQARGEAYRVDGRSDVYSLGVVLYQMLTQELPFRGKLRMLLDQVLHEDPRPPRRLNDRIPRDLETITLKCLAKEPSARYQTAGELAAELERFLSGMPIQARPVSRVERAWRWCRRNPAVAASLTAAVAFLLFGLIASSVGYFRVSRALVETEKARADSDASLRDALAAVNDLLTEVSENTLLDQPGMQPLRKDLLFRARHYYQRFLAKREGDPALRDELAAAHFRIGLITEEIDSPAEALASFWRAEEMQKRLLSGNPSSTAYLTALGDTLNAMGRCSQKEHDVEQAAGFYSRTLRIRERLVQLNPSDAESRRKLANIHMNRGLLGGGGDLAFAQSEIEAAQSIRQSLLDAGHDTAVIRHDLTMGRYALARLASDRGDLETAGRFALETIADFEHLIAQEGSSIDRGYEYAVCYRFLGDAELGKAKASLVESGADNAGWVDGMERALTHYNEAIRRLGLLVKENPAVAKLKIALAGIEVSRGTTLAWLQKDDWGLGAFSMAETFLSSVIEEGTGGPAEREELITALSGIVNVHHQMKRPAEATAALERLRSHLESFHRKFPGEGGYEGLLEETRGLLERTRAAERTE